MTLPIVFLSLLTAAFAWAVLWYGGVVASDWNITLLGVGLVALAYWVTAPRNARARRLDKWIRLPLLLLPCYAALQLVPLPLSILRIVSPARAELARAIVPIGRFAPLAASLPAGVSHFFRIAAYVSVFLLVRELAWRLAPRRWAVVIPILLVAGFEAALGGIQMLSEGGKGVVSGTYVDRDHFAGLLEMSLPFAVLYAVSLWRRHVPVSGSTALLAGSMGALAALMLFAVVFSLSRMGFLIAICSVFLAIALAAMRRIASRRARWSVAIVLSAALLATLILLPPNQLIERFGDMTDNEGPSGGTRLQFWRDTLKMIGDFPVFGCGLGGYESVFLRYQTDLPLMTVAYAHNDYLQFLAEFGIAGGIILAVLLAGVLAKAVAGVAAFEDPEHRYLAIACCISLMAILAHSIVDFNLQIPANAMLFAWIAAVTVSNPVRSSRRQAD